jgi:RHS repeat-associated protein
MRIKQLLSTTVELLLAMALVTSVGGTRDGFFRASNSTRHQAASSNVVLTGAPTPTPTANPIPTPPNPIPTPRPTLAANSVVPTETTNGQAVGRIKGSGAVTNDGGAQYTVPLWVPKGRGEIQPDLSLVYSSRGGNGPLGVGWGITGMSQITRCRKTFLHDGDAEPVRFADGEDGDRLCLNGQRLVIVDGPNGAESTYGADATEYRTENDMHAKVISYGSDAYGPGFFKMYLKDGRILTFGASTGAAIEGQRINVQPGTRLDSHGLPVDDVFLTNHDQHVRYAWQLSRIEDRAGNFLTIRYKSDTGGDGSESLPEIIEYTAFARENVSLPPTHFVQFTYETRPDATEYYTGGFKLKSSQRLKRIDMRWAENSQASTVLRSYDLHYRNDSISKRSLLDQVQECDGSGVCTPPTRFDWSLGGEGFSDVDTHLAGPQPVFSDSVSSATPAIMPADFNSDGLDDLSSAVISTGTAFQSPPNHGLFGGSLGTRLIDINGDGNLDSVSLAFDCFGSGCDSKADISLSTPPGSPRWRDTVESKWRHAKSPFVVDLDGDGQPDIVNRLPTVPGGEDSVSEWAYRRNTNGIPGAYIETGSKYFEPNPQLTNATPKFLALDVDGSGRGSLLVGGNPYNHNEPSRFSAFSLESGKAKWDTTTAIEGAQYCDTVFLDLNGDGLDDWVSIENFVPASIEGPPSTKGTIYVSMNTGHGFTEPQKDILPEPFASSPIFTCNGQADRGLRVMDYNGDTRQDLLVMSGYEVPGTTGLKSLFILQSNGHGFTPAKFAGEFGILAGKSSGTSSIMKTHGGSGQTRLEDWRFSELLDANGDGLEDFVQVSGDGNLHLYLRSGGKTDLLTGVVDGLGAFERFEHRSISDMSVYAPGSGCHYPQLCLKRGLWVVSLHKMDTGTPVTHDVQYFYRDGRVDMAGRGWIGFAGVTTTDTLKRVTTSVTYDNGTRLGTFYPCASLPRKVTTDTLLGVVSLPPVPLPLIDRRTDIIGCEIVAQMHNRLFFSYPGSIDTSEWQGIGSLSFPRLVLLRKQHEAQRQDAYANVTQMKRLAYEVRGGEPVGRADKLMIATTYDNFDASWLIGQAIRRREISTTRSGQNATRETTYEYYSDTGLLGRVQIEPRQKGKSEIDGSDCYLDMVLERDLYGLVASIKKIGSGDTRTEKFLYDDAEHTFIKAYTNEGGHTSSSLYHPGLGVLIEARDPNGLATIYQYDGFIRPRYIDAPDKADIAFQYDLDADGHLRSTVRPAGGATTAISYDRLGRESKREYEGFDGSLVGSETTYDDQGRIKSVSRPHALSDPANVQSFIYDNLDRPLLVTQADGTSEKLEYQGLKTLRVDEKGNQSFVVQDGVGRIASSGNVAGDGRELLTHFEYGPFDVLTNVLHNDGEATRMEYDRLGRRSTLIDPDSGRRRTQFNAFGETKGEIDGNGNRTDYVRDSLGRVKTKTNKDGVTAFTWDTAAHGTGMLAATSSPDGTTTTYEYDPLSHLQQASWTIAGSKYSFEYSYDDFGRLKMLTYPAVAGHAKFAIQQFYTPRGELQSVQDVSGQHVYWMAQAKNASGQLTRESFGNNLTTVRSYENTRGWLRTVDTQMPTGTKVQALEYNYESNGNVRQREDHLLNSREVFTYDFLDRLTEWDVFQPVGNTVTKYGYNDMGNLMSRTVTGSNKSSETFTYGAGRAGPHALTQIKSTGPDLTYTYDANGNQKTGPGRNVAYTMFDLPSNMSGAGNDIKFRYDAIQNRVSKEGKNGNTTVYAGSLYEKRSAGNETTHVFSVQVEGRTVAQMFWTRKGSSFQADRLFYLHNDQLGSIETLTDNLGKIVERRKYDPFGAPRNSQNLNLPSTPPSTYIRLGFSAHENDTEFALLNLKGRMYDAKVGRFLSADPLVGNPFSSQSYNRYTYAANNPLTFTDPSGFQSTPSGTSRSESDSSESDSSGDVCSGSCTMPPETITGDRSDDDSPTEDQTGGRPPPPPPPRVSDDRETHTSPAGPGIESLNRARDRESTPEAERNAAKVRFNTWTKISGPSPSPLQRIAASPNTPEHQKIMTAKLPIDAASYTTMGALGIFAAIEIGIAGLVAGVSAAFDRVGIWLGSRLVVYAPRVAIAIGLLRPATPSTPTVANEAQTAGTAAAQVGGKLGAVLDAIRREYGGTQPTSLEGAYTVVSRATESLGLETGIAVEFSATHMVLHNVGGVITRLTATGGITVIARGTTVLQLGQ